MSVRLAATMTTVSGPLGVDRRLADVAVLGNLLGGSGPTPILFGCTVTLVSVIATLTRVGGVGPRVVGVFFDAAAGGAQRDDRAAGRNPSVRSASPTTHRGGI